MSLSPETRRADLKRPMNRICCIWLVAYIVVYFNFERLVSCTLRNVAFFINFNAFAVL